MYSWFHILLAFIQFKNENSAKIDGGFSKWSEWSCNSKLCETGIALRFRACNNPKPEFGGDYCFGPEVEEKGISKH